MMTSASSMLKLIGVFLLLFSASSSLGVFRPSKHPTTSLRLGNTVDPTYTLRGGAGLTCIPGEATAEVGPKLSISGEDQTPSIDDNEFVYATIGVLNLTEHGANSILLCYKSNDNNSSRQIHEKWGLSSSCTDDVKNDFAIVETIGCLCRGIVINLPQQIWSNISPCIGSQQLDDILLCLVTGIIRRSKGTQRVTIPVTVICEGAYSSAKEFVVIYVHEYMTRAFYHLCTSKTRVIKGESANSLLLQRNIVARYSDTSAVETAVEMARKMLINSTSDGVRRHDFTSRFLFGTLCSQLYHEIRNADVSVQWEKLSESSNDISSSDHPEDNIITAAATTIDEPLASGKSQSNLVEQHISTNLRRKLESAMAMAFLDAEESMTEMESRIDNSIPEVGGDETAGTHPLPEFASDVDSIVEAVSSTFLAILDDNELSESEKAWVSDQRAQALKQLVGNGIYRLFHLHLQCLRDCFGHFYEIMLDDSTAVDAHNWNLRSRKAARYAEEQFTKAAVGSIPQICAHPEGELCADFVGMFSSVEALRGLLEDMEEVTATRDIEESEWREIMGGLQEESNGDIDALAISHSRLGLRQLIKRMRVKVMRRGPAKWYERLAAKALVIGVNYVQGWLMLQALRREAKKRDTEMPKFPLF